MIAKALNERLSNLYDEEEEKAHPSPQESQGSITSDLYREAFQDG